MNGIALRRIAACLLLATTAPAGSMKASYRVDAKALKAAVAGTPLTFELFTDSACAGPAAASLVVNGLTPAAHDEGAGQGGEPQQLRGEGAHESVAPMRIG
jgi:hypothetical protein